MFKFRRNMSKGDQAARIVISILCIFYGFIVPEIVEQPLVAVLLGCFGILNLISAIYGHCPLYRMAGFSSYSNESHHQR